MWIMRWVGGRVGTLLSKTAILDGSISILAGKRSSAQKCVMEEIFMKQLLKFPLLEAKEAYKGY